MKITPVFTSLMLAVAFAVPTSAGASELNCQMDRYTGAGNQRDVKAIVPVQSLQTINGTSAQSQETGTKGMVEDYGDKIVITYFDELRRVGDVEIKYTYFRKTNRVSVTTRGLRSQPWDQEFPERAGKFTVSGRCSMT